MKPGLFLAAVAVGVAASVTQASAEAEREAVLACLAQMDATTTWDQCRAAMFAPCAAEEVGSEGHLACLAEEQDGWEAMMTARREALMPRLESAAGIELTNLLSQWIGYVSQKCTEVGESRAEISREAAELGCHISEIAGLTLEFEVCATGGSTAPFCTFRD